jgi:hypothetical protein
MKLRRATLLVTCLVVAGLGVWLTMAKWDTASKFTAVISALGAVAAVGVAVWAALAGPGLTGGARARRTGKATARENGVAVTGVVVSARKTAAQVEADRTGDADASAGGEATSGVRLD